MKSFFSRFFGKAAREGRIGILGILNATPDSFSDGAAHNTPEKAVAHALHLVKTGADVLDIGAESTRPGFSPVSAEEQLHRLLPVLSAVRSALPNVPVSVDTRDPLVAKAALAAGATIINDQSGLSNPEMAEIVRRSGAGAIAMRGFAEHAAERRLTGSAADIAGAVTCGLAHVKEMALKNGIPEEALCLDPGFGFGLKGLDNASAASAVSSFAAAAAPCPVLVGPSRKHFLPAMFPGAGSADVATAMFCREAFMRGARIARVHEPGLVAEACRTVLPETLQLDTTASTNDDAMKLALDGVPDGFCVAARTQTAGRGRAGHAWMSPPDVALFFSVIFRPALECGEIPLCTLALGVAVAEAISETTGLAAAVKWPNDILVNDRKCAGLLCEGDFSGSNGPCVVAGVGLNVNNGQDALPQRPIFPATSLKLEANRDFSLQPLLAACRSSMSRWIRILEAPGGRIAVLRRLASLDALKGRRVAVAMPDGRTVQGKAEGIGRDGNLLVREEGAPGPSEIVAGSVSLAG